MEEEEELCLYHDSYMIRMLVLKYGGIKQGNKNRVHIMP